MSSLTRSSTSTTYENRDKRFRTNGKTKITADLAHYLFPMASRFGYVDPDRNLSATRNYRTVEDGFVSLDTGNTPFSRAALESMDLRCPKFGMRFALPRCAKRNGMLKISVIDRRTERRLILEGKLIAPWVAELRTAWKAANGQVGGPTLVVDLRNVTVISQEGENALLELIADGAKFRCSGVLIRHLIHELARRRKGNPREPVHGAQRYMEDD